jgi:hypothetical protein
MVKRSSSDQVPVMQTRAVLPPWYRNGTGLESGDPRDHAGTLMLPVPVVSAEPHVSFFEWLSLPKGSSTAPKSGSIGCAEPEHNGWIRGPL